MLWKKCGNSEKFWCVCPVFFLESLSKICIFAVANSILEAGGDYSELWVAFKNLYLCSREQFFLYECTNRSSCESLSKICIFAVANSECKMNILSKIVVSRFQKFVSLQSRTVFLSNVRALDRLWVAFKNLYLCSREQSTSET